jgi:hypothetical protein
VRRRIGSSGGDLSVRFPRRSGKPDSQSASQHHCAVETGDVFVVLPGEKWKPPIKSGCLSRFSANFRPFILCNDCTREMKVVEMMVRYEK